MVAVAQIYRRDVPGEWWPDGADLLQILWCPNEHWDAGPPQDEGAPTVELRWRTAAEVVGPVSAAVFAGRHEEGLLPQPCTLKAVAAVDDDAHPISRYDVWKIGGFPRWVLADRHEIRCADCGEETTLLFTISSGDVTGVNAGRAGELRIFRCSSVHQHRVAVNLH
ncbi:hypothetical protein [Streptomyces sp. NPDC088762]|uniref:hypothetical protein n=1 Tax=Streptomyces sp. NPDC088762 TaxID=3365891 RepID=UPI00380EF4B3